jgi:hypothetical protein
MKATAPFRCTIPRGEDPSRRKRWRDLLLAPLSFPFLSQLLSLSLEIDEEREKRERLTQEREDIERDRMEF